MSMAEITKVFPQVSLPIQDVDSSSQEAEAKTLVEATEATIVDWSLNPPCMVRIGGDGFTEIAAMESPPGAAFQIAVFANGDRIESCYIFELHF